MPVYVSNRLSFLSNAKTILVFLKSTHPGNEGPVQFSLNSIKRTPEALITTLTPAVLRLSAMNMVMPELDEATRQLALDNVFLGRSEKVPEADLQQEIDGIDNSISQFERESFSRAVANYRDSKFFSQQDWRMNTWGTVEDIGSVKAATFERPTRCLEFETAWTPPIAALQLLSNTFPSVRFRLQYRSGDYPWTEVEFFPFPPFGY